MMSQRMSVVMMMSPTVRALRYWMTVIWFSLCWINTDEDAGCLCIFFVCVESDDMFIVFDDASGDHAI